MRFLEYQYAELRRTASGGVQPNLNLGLIRSIPVPLPPAKEQERICAETDRLLSIVATCRQMANDGVMHISRLRQSILKWAFEGKLVDQDPNDEPASELLARIRAERASAPSPKRRQRAPKARK
jgi:type I restriction enzyme S subunit